MKHPGPPPVSEHTICYAVISHRWPVSNEILARVAEKLLFCSNLHCRSQERLAETRYDRKARIRIINICFSLCLAENALTQITIIFRHSWSQMTEWPVA